MYREIWKKFRRVLAIVLIAALCGSNVPQMLFEVQAETTDGGSGTEDVGLVDIATDTNIEVSFKDTVTDGKAEYTGSAVEPGVKVTYNGVEIVSGGDADYTFSYADNTEVSTPDKKAKVIIIGTAGADAENGYTGTIEKEFSIVRNIADLIFTVNAVTCTGSTIDLSKLDVKVEDEVFSKDCYEISCDSGEVKDMGTYTLTLTGVEAYGYYGTTTVTLEVENSTAITEECVEIKNAFKKDDVYYYKDDVAVVGTTKQDADGNDIVYSVVGCSVDRDETTGVLALSGDETVTFTVNGNGEQGEFSLTFKQDVNAPELTVEAQNENEYTNGGKTWAQKINAPIIAYSDAESGVKEVRYADADLSGVDENALATLDISGYPIWENGAELEGNTTYYFIAIDYADNRKMVSVTTPILDDSAPVIIVKDGEKVIESGDCVYLNEDALTDGKKEFAVTVDDGENGSGVNGDTNSTYTYDPSKNAEAKEIDTTATDNVTNSDTHTFTVVYDTVAPVIYDLKVEAATDDDKAVTVGTKILTKENVLVTVQIQEEYLNEEGQLSEVTLEDVSGGNAIVTQVKTGENVSESGEKKIVEYSWIISLNNTNYLKTTYKVIACDNAGNETESVDIGVEIDKNAPTIGTISSTPDYSQGWVNQNTTFTIPVVDEKRVDEDIKVLWKKDADSEEEIDVWNTIEDWTSVDGTKFTFNIVESDENFKGTYSFKAIDSLGNESVVEQITFKKDTVAPGVGEEDIYVEYVIDEASESNAVTSFFNKISDYLFAKNTVNVVLYVRDNLSGVASVDYTYKDFSGDDIEATALTDEAVSAVKVKNGDSESSLDKTYSVVKFKIEVSAGTNVADNLKILSIKDKAGNEGVPENDKLTSGDFIIIDNVAPTVNIAFNGDCVTQGDDYYIFKNQGATQEQVVLTYTEAFNQYHKNNDKYVNPEIEVITSDGTKVSLAVEPVIEHFDGFITATITLPYGSNEEIEYIITTSYADGSGNKLTLKEGNKCGDVTDGVYVTDKIVLDNKAPEIYGYSIVETPQGTFGADATVSGNDLLNVYKQNTINATFKINDNDAFWTKENVVLTVYKNGSVYETVAGNSEKITWESNQSEANVHSAVYKLEESKPVSATYHIEISYIDLAGNISNTPGNNGIYVGKDFVLDTSAPKFEITYNKAKRLVSLDESSGEGDIKNAVPTTGYIAYYTDKINVTFTITERYAQQLWTDNNLSCIEDLKLHVWLTDAKGKKKDYSLDENFAIKWEKKDNEFIGKFTLDKEGSYEIKIDYSDRATNKMVVGNEMQGNSTEVKKGKEISYSSIKMVIDNSLPDITAQYIVKKGNKATVVKPVNELNGRKYFDKSNLILRITVKDENIRADEVKKVLKNIEVLDSSKKAIKDSDAEKMITGIQGNKLYEGSYTIDIPLSTEGNYTIPVSYTDLAGNKINLGNQLVTVDRTKPEVELSYKIERQSGTEKIENVIRYFDIGYLFADSKMTVEAKAADEIAGIQNITFDIQGDEGDFKPAKNYKPAAAKTYSASVPVKSGNSNFNGTIDVIVTDWSKNQCNEKHNYIVESSAKHESTSSAMINVNTAPGRTVDGIAYYNTSVNLTFEFKDEYAGIGQWEYSTEKESKSDDYQKKANEAYDKANAYNADYKLLTEHKEEFELNGNQYNYNGVKVYAKVVDNVGHENNVEKEFNIDVTKPIINVSYDLNDPANERYYNAARTATVVIQERNFDERDVEFTITNTDGVMPSISGWSSSGSGDDTYHTCYVTFAEDGDYTFTVAFQDLAGNVADYDIVDEFTIDRTIPTYTVTYDNNESKNGYYYAAERTATIDIVEHNFDASLVNIAMTATKGESGVPAVSGWSRSGDHNIATIYFSEDADYTFDISGLDMAENPLDDYEMDHFVIDTKAPELTIDKVEDMFAYNGIIMPEIRYSDINYDAENSVIEMQGYKNGKFEMQGDITKSDTGVEIKLHDIEHVQEMDDIYTMNATVFDLAGNSSEASIRFSVNRFGSVYTFDDEKTEELIGANGKYYTREEQDLIIMETNVDTLEFMEITCNLNGKLYTLEEGVHYTLEESGSDMSWKQYTYTISKDNFVEEGTYLLTIYSKDRATNTSDNSSKGKKIEFVVDKTNPSVLISGIVNGEQYRESSREVTLDIQDNVRLSEVKVKLNGQESVYTAAQLEELNGKVILNIGRNNDWQTLQVTAYDAAGNSVSSEELQFLVTTNILIHLIRNTPLLILVGAIVIVIGAGGFYIFGYKKRKKGTQSK